MNSTDPGSSGETRATGSDAPGASPPAASPTPATAGEGVSGGSGGHGGGEGGGWSPRRRKVVLVTIAVLAGLVTVLAAALLANIAQRKAEGEHRWVRVVEVDEDTIDPAIWGKNWPHQYDTYKLTTDYERTRYGGSSAVPEQKLDKDPWLRTMWAGYAFSLDYREARGHAYMLVDQEETERVLEVEQPGACLHCHSSVLPAYRHVGDGDIMEGFRKVNAMPWSEARYLEDEEGELLVDHPISCVDCHDPKSMELRITRPAFKKGIAALKKHEEGIEDYDVNRDATRQEMRSYTCAQCHVEYYFTPEDNQLVYPWAKGIKAEQMEAYFDEIGFSDWEHGVTGAGVLKVQHPEFELWSQGIHARAGVSCADCHMPYERVGAKKISNHHVRSPLLNINRSCQTCHNVEEEELLARAHNIQDKTRALLDRSGAALQRMVETIAAAQQAGATQEDLAEALALQRKSQWRIDFVYSENSMGFHAPQEAARLLAEALDYARQGEVAAHRAAPEPIEPIEIDPEVLGVTPADKAPPSPYDQD